MREHRTRVTRYAGCQFGTDVGIFEREYQDIADLKNRYNAGHRLGSPHRLFRATFFFAAGAFLRALFFLADDFLREDDAGFDRLRFGLASSACTRSGVTSSPLALR